MILRVVLFLLMGIGLAGFSTYAWRGLHHPAPVAMATATTLPPLPPPVMSGVLIAAHDVRGGALLKPDDLGTLQVPADAVATDAERDTPAQRNALAGALLLHSLVRGQAITVGNVLLSGDHGFLAAILAPGMRAFTISRDDILADAGLVWPGDRLDLILTDAASADSTAGRRISAETVLTNVRVLAIDQQLVAGAPEQGKSTSSAAITVEVTPAGADRLALALRLGKLALAICPTKTIEGVAGGSAAVPPAGAHASSTAVWAGDVMHSLNGATDGRGAMATVHVFSGHEDAKEFHF